MLLELMMPPVMELFSAILSPMIGMGTTVFVNALEVMRIEGVNPILAIANMGTSLIDGVGNVWIAIIIMTVPASMWPPTMALLMCVIPILSSWMGIMLTVGFSAAFYVPFIPLLIFTFASIGWLIGVVEAMVAAPIVALGVVHPDGHEALGKGDQAVMLLLGMFLRPAMMVIGYIFGIIISYVSVWVMNAGFNLTIMDMKHLTPIDKDNIVPEINSNRKKSMYGFWSNIFLFYFTMITYATLYMAIVQQAFELIYFLPDRVLRWLSGGNTETFGSGAVDGMLKEVQGVIQEASSSAASALQETGQGASDTMRKNISGMH
jgi:defect in organelle trafficking protein DotA